MVNDRLNAMDQAALSLRVFEIGGFRGRSRNSRSSFFATAHQFLHGRLRVTNHRTSGTLHEAVVPLSWRATIACSLISCGGSGMHVSNTLARLSM